MVTIKDIAKKLGVSYSTVSRCLNDDRTVSDETKKKVVIMADQMGFSFNVNARNLVKRETGRIGIILSNNFNSLSNRWFFNEISGYSIGAIETHKFDFILQPNANIYGKSNIFKLIRGQMVDGLVIASKHVSQEEYDFLTTNHIPCVFVYFKPIFVPGTPANLFYDDNEYGGYIATKHLIDRGHRKILTITSGDETLRMYNERTAGYQRALAESGLPEQILVSPQMNFESQDEFVRHNIDVFRECTALFSQQDLVALGTIKTLEKHFSFSVPRDLSVIGYNNIDLIRYMDIPLTTIEDPRETVISNAVEFLVGQIKGAPIANIVNKLYPALITRGTVSPVNFLWESASLKKNP